MNTNALNLLLQPDIYDIQSQLQIEAAAELATLRQRVAELEKERDKLKVMCAKAYFDIYGGVRKEIYDAYGDELSALAQEAQA